MSPLKRILFVTLFLAGCSTHTQSYNPTSNIPPTDSQKVEILGDTPHRPYKELGEITEKGNIYSSDEGMRQSVRNEAAKLGADAVIITSHTKSGYDYIQGQKKEINAIAIKWTGPANSIPLPPASTPPSTSSRVGLPQPH